MARRGTTPVEEKLITAEELARMKIDYPCELVEGKIVRMSPAGMRHTLVIGRINGLLVSHVSRKKLGMVTSGDGGYLVRRSPDTVRAPDLAFLSHATLERAEKSRGTFFPCAPDLAVEVLSPDNTWKEIEKKVADYLDAGSKLVWVASPLAEKVYVYESDRPGRVLSGRDTIDGGKALPGFKAKVARFFRDER